MQEKTQELLEMRLQRLKEENHSLREGMSSIKTDNISLRRSLKNRDSLFNSMPVGIILIQQGEILEVNKTLLEQLGYKAKEMQGHDFLEFVHRDQKRYVRGIYSAWDSGKMVPDRYDVRLVKQNDETIFCEATVKRIRFKNRTAFLLNLTRLEKRKENEKKSLHLAKMEALFTMAKGMVHMFRAQLEALSENINDLKAIPCRTDNKDVKEEVNDIETRSSMVLSMVTKMEAFAGRGNDNHEMTSLDINDLVNEAVADTTEIWRDGPANNGLKIDVKTYLRSSSSVEGDQREIKDALCHLITNAVEAMPNGGEIDITTEETPGYSHLYIQDSGIGIPGQLKEKIFDPFFTTKDDEFRGIGLSIAYSIFKKHRGDIEIMSQEGQGAIFHIKLPLASQEERARPLLDRKKIQDAQVLIIQEEDVARELLSHMLSNKGCNVDTANNGLEGLGKLKRKKFDLVVADMTASPLEGNSFLKKSRKIDPKLPVVMIKADAEGKQFDDNETEADLKIMKPLNINKAVKQILELLMFRRI